MLMIFSSLSGSVMPNISFPLPAFSSGTRSNFTPKALWNSLGSRAAKSPLSVMMRTSPGINVLQYSRTPYPSARAQHSRLIPMRHSSLFTFPANEIITVYLLLSAPSAALLVPLCMGQRPPRPTL